jgi:TetR/AcrR family transcriptional regulator, regulator of cefoperazone and chloramphenicol sensitivity
MSSTSTQRPKKPNRQQVSAAATRQEILLAARRLFGSRGYASVSIAEIAEEAGVSIPTIYASVGPKQAIVMALVALIDLQVGGADATNRVETETNPHELIGIGVHLNRLLQQNFGDIVAALRSAAQVEAALAKRVAAGEQMHRYGAGRMAARLDSLGVLKSNLTVAEAADIVTLLTDVDFYSKLVNRFGWSFDRAEAWINDALRAILLRDPAESTRA